MALPTLDRYRQANPSDTRSDEELLPLIVSEVTRRGNLQSYPDLAEYAAAEELDFRRRNAPGFAQELANAVARGTDTAQGQLYSTVAQAGDALSMSGVRDFGLSGYRRNLDEAAENAPTIGSYEEVGGVSDAIRYGLGIAGSNAPQLGATLGLAALGTAVAGPIGGAALATAGAYTQTQNYADLVEQGAEDALATSLTVGAASSLLEAFTPLKLVSKLGLGGVVKETGESLVQSQLKRVIARVPEVGQRIVAASAENALGEAGTEVAQELIAIAGEEYANRNNPDFELTADEIRGRLVNAGLGGFILGGGLGPIEVLGQRRPGSTPTSEALAVQPEAAEEPSFTPRPVSPNAAAPSDEPIVTPSTAGTPFEQPVTTTEEAVAPVLPRYTPDPFADYGTAYRAPLYPAVIERPAPATVERVAPQEGFTLVEPAPESKKGLPAWAREEMIRQGIDPNRELNDYDIQNPSVIAAVNSDPTLTPEEKERILRTGSRRVIEDVIDVETVAAPAVTRTILPPVERQVAVDPSDNPGVLVESLTEGVRKSRTATNKLVVVYDTVSETVQAMGLYYQDGRYRVTNGVRAATARSLAKELGVSEGTFNRYKNDPNANSELAQRVKQVWAERGEAVADDTLNEFVSVKNPTGSPRYIPLRQVTLSQPFDGNNVVWRDPADFYRQYPEADAAARTKAGKVTFVPIIEAIDSDDTVTVESDELGSEALVDRPDQDLLTEQTRDAFDNENADVIPDSALLSGVSSDTLMLEEGDLDTDTPLSRTEGVLVDESAPIETALSATELEAARRFLERGDEDVYDAIREAVPAKDRAKDRVWADVQEDIISAITKAVTAVRKLKPGQYVASRDFAYKFYKDGRKLIDFTQPIGTNYRDTSAEITTKFNQVLKGLADLGVDVNLVLQSPQSAIEFVRNEWGVTITEAEGRRLVALTLADVSNPTRQNLRSLMHEVAHLATNRLPRWQQALVEDAIERMDGLKAKVFSETLDRRIKGGELPRATLLKEVLAEHLAEIGVVTTEARSIAQVVIDAIVKLLAQAAMLYGQLRGQVFLPSLSVRYAEIRFKEYLEGVLISPNDVDTLQGTDRWVARKAVTFFKPTNEGAEVETYDPTTGTFTPQTVIDDSSFAAAFNFETDTTPGTVEYTQPDANVPRGVAAVQKLFNEVGLSASAYINGGDLLARVSKTRSPSSGFNALLGGIYKSAMARSVRVKIAATPGELSLLRQEDEGGRTTALYRPEFHEIIFDPEIVPNQSPLLESYYARTMVHEVVHAGTAHSIEMYLRAQDEGTGFIDNDPNLSDGERAEFKKVIQSTKRLDRIYTWLKSRNLKGLGSDASDTANYDYGMTNLDEFAAAVGSDTEFLRKLAAIKLPEYLQSKGITTVYDAVIDWLLGIFNMDRASAAPAALEALGEIIAMQDASQESLARFMENPRGEFRELASKYSEDLSDEQTRFRVEQSFANINSVIDLYAELYTPAADAARMGLRQYLTEVLRMRDPFVVRERLELELGRLPRPIQVNTELRLSPQNETQTVESELLRKRLLDRVFVNVQSAYNRMTQRFSTDSGDLKKLEDRAEFRKGQLAKVDEYLNDVLAQRDDVNKSLAASLTELRRELRSASAKATIAGDFSRTLSRILGLGDQTALGQEYLDALDRVVKESPGNFALTDALTAASQLDIDWASDSIELIQTKLQGATGSLRTALLPLFQSDALGRTTLAAVIHYGRQNPVRMAGFAVKVSKAGKEKTDALNAIRDILTDSRATLQSVEQEIRDARKSATLVGKVKLQYRQVQLKFLKEQRAFEQLNRRLEAQQTALPILDKRLTELRFEKGIRQNVELFDGAIVFTTPSPTMTEAEVLASKKTLRLSGEGINAENMQVLMDNQSWLSANKNLRSDLYFQIEDQVKKLRNQFQREQTLNVAGWRFTKFLEPLYNKVVASGLRSARVAGAMLRDYEAKKLEARTKANKGAEVGARLAEFKKVVELPYDAVVSMFLNPAFRFIENNNQIIEGSSNPEQAVYRALREYFLNNPITQPLISRAGAYDKFFAFLKSNYEAGKLVTTTGEGWGVRVKDVRIKVLDPRTGRLREVYRPALEQGFFTGHRTIRRISETVFMLKSLKLNGESVWMKASEGGAAALTAEERGAMFDKETMDVFVSSFANDLGFVHFYGPSANPDLPSFKAQPVYVAQAFAESGGNIAKFGQRLFELELGLTPEEIAGTPELLARLEDYQNEIIQTLVRKFDQFNSLHKESEQASKLGLESVPHQAMDSRLASDIPAEFLEYQVYDKTSLWAALAGLAAHSAFGRDLGYTETRTETNSGWAAQLQTIRKDIEQELAPIDLAYARVRRANPTMGLRELDKLAAQSLGENGKAIVDRRTALLTAKTDLDNAELELRGLMSAPGGGSRDTKLAQDIVGTLAGLMVQTIKGSILQTAPLFDPFIKLRMSKEAVKQVGNNWVNLGRTGLNSMGQSVGLDLVRSSKWSKILEDLNLMQDPAQTVGVREIWADSGPNNAYERDRVLGYLRRGRSVLFNFSPRLGNATNKTGVAFRPFAPFTTTTLSVNQSLVQSSLESVETWLKNGVDYFLDGRMDREFKDPAFQFTAETAGFTGVQADAAFTEMQEKFLRMGTTFEFEVRRALTEQQSGKELPSLLSPDLIRSVASLTLEEVSVESSPMTIPSWFHNNWFGRMSAPLVTWPVGATNRMLGAMRNAQGEAEWGAFRSFALAMLFGTIPAGIAISILMDEFDDEILRKQSNLADFVFDVNDPNFAAQNATAFIERMARVGTFGLAGDVVNGIRVYGSDGDLRGLSFDQRVLFANTILTLMGTASTLVHQEGEVTYASFWRPLGSALGGNAAMQNMQILNTFSDELMGVPLFGFEARVTAKINANNYLRSAGRVLNLDVRTGAGMKSLPTPTKPWIGEMVLSAYSNDRRGFAAAYKNAIRTATEEGRDDPVDYVKRSFGAYHPLKSAFKTPPSVTEYERLLGAMGTDGRRDVSEAVLFFNTYGETIGVKPYLGKQEKTPARTQRGLPSAY